MFACNFDVIGQLFCCFIASLEVPVVCILHKSEQCFRYTV